MTTGTRMTTWTKRSQPGAAGSAGRGGDAPGPRGTLEDVMTDPYEVLGIAADADDEAIRRRYLELVRQYTPEHHPERFAAIRAAYESLRDLDTRLRFRLFEAGRKETVNHVVEELTRRAGRRRAPWKSLLA